MSSLNFISFQKKNPLNSIFFFNFFLKKKKEIHIIIQFLQNLCNCYNCFKKKSTQISSHHNLGFKMRINRVFWVNVGKYIRRTKNFTYSTFLKISSHMYITFFLNYFSHFFVTSYLYSLKYRAHVIPLSFKVYLQMYTVG